MWFNQVQLTNSQTTTKWSNVLSLDHLEQPRAVIEQSDRFHKRLSFFWGTRGQRNRRRSGVTTSWRCKLTMRRRMLLFNQKHKNTKTAGNTSSLFTFSQGRLLFSTVQLRDEFLQTTFACPFQQFFLWAVCHTVKRDGLERAVTTRPNNRNTTPMLSETELMLTNYTFNWYNSNHTEASLWCHGSPPGVWKRARKAECVMSLQSLNHIRCLLSPRTLRRPTSHTVASRNTFHGNTSGISARNIMHNAFSFVSCALKHLMPPPGGDNNYTNGIKLYLERGNVYLVKAQIVMEQPCPAHVLENPLLLLCIAEWKDSRVKKKKQNAKEKRIYSLKYRDYFKLPGMDSLVANVQLYILPQPCFKKTECKMCMSHIEEG